MGWVYQETDAKQHMTLWFPNMDTAIRLTSTSHILFNKE